jgi:uncharacterized lipoprotein
MRFVNLRLAIPLAALAVAGCGLLPDAYSGCDDLKPYQAAKDAGQLRVPPDADLPDTRNALKIPPASTAPEVPLEAGTCLEHPPAYGKERPQPKKDG